MKTTLEPQVLRWARIRAGLSRPDLAKKLGFDTSKVAAWESDGVLTLKQAAALAQTTHTPFGYLMLPRPPVETLPIQDFRTIGDSRIKRLSPNLLEIIYQAQRRQEWYRNYLIENKEAELGFVGTMDTSRDIVEAANEIRSAVGIGPEISFSVNTWTESLQLHIEKVEDAGIVVMQSSIVGNATQRRLSTDEFRGFALCDNYAPVIFINTSDSKAAQLFTIAHELVHVWVGSSAVFNFDKTFSSTNKTERFCNAVAAELLIPLVTFKSLWKGHADAYQEVRRLARAFKVSSLVTARRALDAGFIDKDEFDSIYKQEYKRFRTKKGDGGNFYATAFLRVGRRLATKLIVSTTEGNTPYREAMRLMGINNINTFHEMAKRIGMG